MDRDQKERGRSVDSIINQYFATVQPMYEEIIELKSPIILPASKKLGDNYNAIISKTAVNII